MYVLHSEPSKVGGRIIRTTVVGEFEGTNLKLAAARCSNNDRYLRKKGVAIARGRLNSIKEGRSHVFKTEVGKGALSHAETFNQMASEFARSVASDTSLVTPPKPVGDVKVIYIREQQNV